MCIRDRLRPGGALLLVDVHPDTRARGWRRTFRDEAGTLRAVRWRAHDERELLGALGAAGLRLERWVEPALDPARLPAGAPSAATAGPALYGLRARR